MSNSSQRRRDARREWIRQAHHDAVAILQDAAKRCIGWGVTGQCVNWAAAAYLQDKQGFTEKRTRQGYPSTVKLSKHFA